MGPTPPHKRRTRRIVLFSLLAVFALGTGALLYVRSKAPPATGFGGFRPGGAPGGRRGPGGFGMGAPLPVVVNVARKGNINIILNGLGTVTPLATITVRTQISGELTEIKFKEDQMVAKGDVLALIDSRPYQAALDQAQGQLLQAQAQYREAQIDLDRYSKLSEQDSISKQQVDSQRALVSQYEGMVKADEGAVASAQVNLGYCQITAPVAGRVGLRQVDQGNYVTPGDANGIVILAQVKPITVIFTLPEDNIPQVVKQLRSGATIQVDAYNRDNSVKLASGTLSTVDNTVDPTTGTFKLRAMFANDDESLFPNQFVNVAMLVSVDKGVTVVPTSSIERGQQGSFVYVVGDDNKVSAKPVVLGPTEGEKVEVTSGISPGEKVVVDGADRLKDGMEVVASFPSQQPGAAQGRPWSPDGKKGGGGWPRDGSGAGQGGDHKRWGQNSDGATQPDQGKQGGSK
jgi:multidrug efflux system membrane fusion protein